MGEMSFSQKMSSCNPINSFADAYKPYSLARINRSFFSLLKGQCHEIFYRCFLFIKLLPPVLLEGSYILNGFGF